LSSIGWIDFSSTDRERVSQVLALLREPGTLDELGIGQVRDAFADILFPGFSTIQTRAKYFVMVPQIFADYWKQDAKIRTKQKLEDYLKNAEDVLAAQLSKNHSHSEPFPTGIIGHTLVGKGGATNRPSSVYWTGLRKFGLVETRLSLAEYCRTSTDEQAARLLESDEDAENDDTVRQRRSVATVPGTSAHWREDICIELSRNEAEFLCDKIRYSEEVRDSVPAQIINAGLLDNADITQAPSFSALSARLVSHDVNVSSRCKDIALRARRFSDAVEGAHIRFNRVIAEKLGHAERTEVLDNDFAQWREQAHALGIFHEDALHEWTHLHPDNVLRLSLNTVKFLRDWNAAMLSGEAVGELDRIVERQAVANKGNRSLLKKSLSADTDWRGMRALEYRWPQVRQIIGDLREGLAC